MILLVFRRRVDWWLFLFGAVLGLLIALPFVAYVIDQPELKPAALMDAGLGAAIG